MADSNDLQLVVRAIDEASATLTKVKEQVQQLGDGTASSMAKAESASASASAGINTRLLAVTAVLTTATAGAERFGQASVNAFEQAQNTNAQLNSVLQSTGKGASITADQIDTLANSLSQYSGYEDEAIKQGQTLLLQFSGITKDTLPQASQVMVDLARRMGVDVTEAAKTLGMVLTEPDIAMRRLRTSGIVLSTAQLDAIRTMQQHGQSAQAVATVMQMLEERVGGASGAFRGTFAGSVAEAGVQMTQMQEQVGGLVQFLQPLVEWISQAVAAHQRFIVALFAAGTATAVVVGGLAAIIGAAMFVVTTLGGPLTLVLLAVGALMGTFLYSTITKLQNQFGDLTKTVAGSTGAMGNAADDGFGQASKAADDLAKKLQAIDDNVVKANRDFQESLAEIVKTHEDKIAQLTSQVNQEQADFSKSQQQKTDDFKQSQQDQKDAHEQRVADIQKQLDDEVQKGRFADLSRLSDLKLRLQQENSDYAKSTAEKLQQYQTDTSNAQDQHQTKLNDLQSQLGQETAFMQKHTADLQGIRAADALDEIDKLKQSHADQLAQYDKQKKDLLDNATSTTNGMADAFNKLPGLVKTDALNDVGTDLGKNMADALKKAFHDTMVDWWNRWGNWVNGVGDAIGKFGLNEIKAGAHIVFPALPSFASGVTDFQGGLAYVHQGEMLVNLPKGTDVIPARQVQQPTAGATQNNTFHVYNQVDPMVIARELGWELAK